MIVKASFNIPRDMVMNTSFPTDLLDTLKQEAGMRMGREIVDNNDFRVRVGRGQPQVETYDMEVVVFDRRRWDKFLLDLGITGNHRDICNAVLELEDIKIKLGD